jgi:hypothetical protein
MDISAVLPSSMGQAQSDSTSSLNEEFSATTPNGDKVFTKPVGEKTVFSTPNGGQGLYIVVTCANECTQTY